MQYRGRSTVAPLVLLALAACGGSDAGSPDVTEAAEIEVVVDVMSGVPNPTWTVLGSDAARLLELINTLPEVGSVDATAGQDHLGFRGFVLRGPDLPGDEVRVLGTDVVVLHGTSDGRLHADEDRSVYTMLRTMSAEHLDENVMQAIPVDGLKGS
jgi:hypothetical protein